MFYWRRVLKVFFKNCWRVFDNTLLSRKAGNKLLSDFPVSWRSFRPISWRSEQVFFFCKMLNECWGHRNVENVWCRSWKSPSSLHSQNVWSEEASSPHQALPELPIELPPDLIQEVCADGISQRWATVENIQSKWVGWIARGLRVVLIHLST